VISITDIEAARERISGRVRHTPVLPLNNLKTALTDKAAAINLKLECLQVTGSFKARGAMNRLLATPFEQYRRGIVTASGGNHGLAVARTAFAAGVPATIFVPEGVSPAKVAKMKTWNATVEVAGKVWDEANVRAIEYARER
jgi:threonine dehydratase